MVSFLSIFFFKNDYHQIFIFWWQVVSSVSAGASFHLTWKQINMVPYRNPLNLKNCKKVLLGENKMHMVFVMTACSLRKEITICITWRLLVLNLCRWFSSQHFWVVSMALQTVRRMSWVAMLDHTDKHSHPMSFENAVPNIYCLWRLPLLFVVELAGLFYMTVYCKFWQILTIKRKWIKALDSVT